HRCRFNIQVVGCAYGRLAVMPVHPEDGLTLTGWGVEPHAPDAVRWRDGADAGGDVRATRAAGRPVRSRGAAWVVECRNSASERRNAFARTAGPISLPNCKT